MACRYCQSHAVTHGVCASCRRLLVHGEMDGSAYVQASHDSYRQLAVIGILLLLLALFGSYVAMRLL